MFFQAFSEIEMRENELGLIRDGCKTATKKAKPTKKTQREAMKGYMKMFYDKERIQVGFVFILVLYHFVSQRER